MGTKAANIQREIAAAVHYGFLEKSKDGYTVTDLLKTAINPLDEIEKNNCLREAFGNPKLYAELIEKHDGHVLPTELKTHLIRFHKIAEKAAPEVADGFIENARLVGVLNPNGILKYKQKVQVESLNIRENGQSTLVTPETEAPEILDKVEPPPSQKPPQETPLLGEMEGK